MHHAVFELFTKYGLSHELADLHSPYLSDFVESLVDTEVAPLTDKLLLPKVEDCLIRLEAAYKTLIDFKQYKKCY
jgi:hypothetical protein